MEATVSSKELRKSDAWNDAIKDAQLELFKAMKRVVELKAAIKTFTKNKKKGYPVAQSRPCGGVDACQQRRISALP
jgi:hypothetical protein